MTTATATATEIRDVPVALITAGDNDRTRFDAAALDQLAASIDSNGLAQPITVRPTADGFQIVAGERRFRAVSSIGWTTIPAIVRDLTDAETADIMLVENTGRVDLDPIDEARAYAKRMAEGAEAADVAKVAGVSVVRVRFRVKLLNLIDDAQALVRRGDLPLGSAQAMHELDRNRQRMALTAMARKDLSALAFKELCAKLLDDQRAEGMETLDFDLAIEEAAEQTDDQRKRASRADLIAALEAAAAALPEGDAAAQVAAVLENA